MATNVFDNIAPVFTKTLKSPKVPVKPSDGAIRLAQKSYDGQDVGGEKVHVMRHRFATVEMAEAAADELRRAGHYTTPQSSVRVVIDPDKLDDKRLVAWIAGARRGRAASTSA